MGDLRHGFTTYFWKCCRVKASFGALPLAGLLIWGVNRTFQIAFRADSPDRPLAVELLGAFAAFIFASLVELTFVRYWVVIMLATLIGLAATLKKPHPFYAGD
jgi:hypothetical protein